MPATTGVAVLIGAAVGAGASIYTNSRAQSAADDRLDYANRVQSQAAMAEAESIIGSSRAEASSIYGKAKSDATAFRQQARVEADALFAAAEESRAIAYKNLDKMQFEANESIRRLESEQKVWEEKAKVKVAASGVTREGSPGLYIDELEAENKRQAGWLKKSYATALDVARSTADAEYRITRKQGEAAIKGGDIQASASMRAGKLVSDTILTGGTYAATSKTKIANAFINPISPADQQRISAVVARKKVLATSWKSDTYVSK